MKLDLALKWLHVSANLFWLGGLCAVALVLLADAETTLRGTLARSIYLKLAVPAFLVSLLAGVGRLVMDVPYFLSRTHFMHAKLVFALAVIAIHHLIGARAKKLATGRSTDLGPLRMLLAGLVLTALAATFTVVFKLPR